MTRKKGNLAYVTNDPVRKATFKKRKEGLIKKVNELTNLCGSDACTIIYSPYNPEPEVFPSPPGVQQVLTRFRMMSETEQNKKMVNQESFLEQQIDKANKQLRKQRQANREKEITQIIFQSLTGGASFLQGLNIPDLNDLSSMIGQNLKEIDKQIERLSGKVVQEDCKLQLQVATEGMPGNGSGGDNSALVSAATTDRLLGFEVANMDNVHKAKLQWFLD